MQTEVLNCSHIFAVLLRNGVIIQGQITTRSFSLKQMISFFQLWAPTETNIWSQHSSSLCYGGQESIDGCTLAPVQRNYVRLFLLKLLNSCFYIFFPSYHFLDTISRNWVTSLVIIKRPIVEENCWGNINLLLESVIARRAASIVHELKFYFLKE